MREQVIETTLEKKLIAIVRGMARKDILPLAEALCRGGINMIEVTFNQADPDGFSTTGEAIRALDEHFKGEVLVGAGTVITPQQLEIAHQAGALYIISPNVDPVIIQGTRQRGLVSMPGAFTPSECVTAADAGADFIKLFPLGNMGPGYLKAVRAPLSHLRFLGVGGISEKNVGEFLRAGACGFGVGGGLVNKEWIMAGAFDKITALAKEYVAAVSVNG